MSVSLPVGSSPLVRGKLESGDRQHLDERIIPACAGQTVCVLAGVESDADHPRLCGANGVYSLYVITDSGSSPLVRGKRGEP